MYPRPEEAFVVSNGDVLTDIRYGELLDFHSRNGAAATMAVRMHEWQHPFGVVRTDGVDIIGFEEKPISRSHINAGIYVLEPRALDTLSTAEHCDMPTLFTRLQEEAARTIVYPMHEPCSMSAVQPTSNAPSRRSRRDPEPRPEPESRRDSGRKITPAIVPKDQSNVEKRDVIKQYNLPVEVRFCRKCTISNQRPRITFDADGVCSACNYAAYKRERVDWKQRDRELIELCDRYRKGNGDYDVIVPCSGGKDGGFVAPPAQVPVRHESPHRYLGALEGDRDWQAQSGCLHRLGLRQCAGHAEWKGHPAPDEPGISLPRRSFPAFHLRPDKFSAPHGRQIWRVADHVRRKRRGEYGGDNKNAFRPDREIQDHDKHYFSGLPPEFWTEHDVSVADLKPFMAPSHDEIVRNRTTIHFLGYYKFWDPQENFYYCTEHTGFTPNTERSEGTYSKYASLDDRIDGYHYHLAYIKFGIGRTTSDAAHEIRDSKITREEGVALVKRYDGEFPKKYFEEFLEYCAITKDEFEAVLDSWRSPHLWERTSDGWRLKHTVWDQG